MRCLFVLILVAGLSSCGRSATPTALVSFVPIEAEPLSAENGSGGGIVARVNNQPIFLEAFEKQVTRVEQSLLFQGIDLSSESGQQRLAHLRQQVLETLIDQLIIEQQAARLNITVSEQTVEIEAKNMVQAQNQAQFEAWLAANNLSVAEFRETLHYQLIANQVFERVTSPVSDTIEKERLFNEWLLKQRSAAVIERYVAF